MPEDNTQQGATGASECGCGGGSEQARFSGRMEGFERKFREKMKEVDQMVRDGIRTVVPPEVGEHLNNSKREFLLAIRRVIDREIERTDKDTGTK